MGYPEQPIPRATKYKLRHYTCRVCGRTFKDYYLSKEKRVCSRCLEKKGQS